MIEGGPFVTECDPGLGEIHCLKCTWRSLCQVGGLAGALSCAGAPAGAAPIASCRGLWGPAVLGLLCSVERGQGARNVKAPVWEVSLWFPRLSARVPKCRGPDHCVVCWDQTGESLQSFLRPERNDLKRWLDSLGDKNAIFICRVGRAREKRAKCWERAVAVLLRALCVTAGDEKGFGVQSCRSLPPRRDPRAQLWSCAGTAAGLLSVKAWRSVTPSEAPRCGEFCTARQRQPGRNPRGCPRPRHALAGLPAASFPGRSARWLGAGRWERLPERCIVGWRGADRPDGFGGGGPGFLPAPLGTASPREARGAPALRDPPGLLQASVPELAGCGCPPAKGDPLLS